MKKTFAALTLAAVMAFGSTFSFAGIILSDKSEPTPCVDKDGIIIFSGIILSGLAFGPGIIIFDAKSETCVAPDKDGIILSD